MAETRRIAELDSNGTLKPDQVPADVVHQADLGAAASMSPVEVVTDPDAQAALSGAFVKGTVTEDHAVLIGGENGTAPENSVIIGRRATTTAQDYAVTLVGGLAGRNWGGTEGLAAFGYRAGYLAAGRAATCVGVGAGEHHTGDLLTAVGSAAGTNQTGTRCTLIGRSAGREQTGEQCTALGVDAAYLNEGNDLIAIGRIAGRGNTGHRVIAIGRSAGYNNTRSNRLIVHAPSTEGPTAWANPLIDGRFTSGTDADDNFVYVKGVKVNGIVEAVDGLVLRSPNGRWLVTVDDDGVLTATSTTAAVTPDD